MNTSLFEQLVYIEKVYITKCTIILTNYLYEMFRVLWLDSQTQSSVLISDKTESTHHSQTREKQKHLQGKRDVQVLQIFLRELNLIHRWDPKVVQSRLKQLRDKHNDVLNLLEEVIHTKMRIFSVILNQKDNPIKYNRLPQLVKKFFFQTCKSIASKFFERPGLFVQSDYLTTVKLQHQQKKWIQLAIQEELDNVVPTPSSSDCSWYPSSAVSTTTPTKTTTTTITPIKESSSLLSQTMNDSNVLPSLEKRTAATADLNELGRLTSNTTNLLNLLSKQDPSSPFHGSVEKEKKEQSKSPMLRLSPKTQKQESFKPNTKQHSELEVKQSPKPKKQVRARSKTRTEAKSRRKTSDFLYDNDESDRKDTPSVSDQQQQTNKTDMDMHTKSVSDLLTGPIEPFHSLPKHVRPKSRFVVEDGFEEVSRTPNGVSLQRRKSSRKIKT